VTGVGVGSPGVVIQGTVGGAANVPGFLERFSLADLLTQKVDKPVRITNDVTAAAVGEHRLGAARGTADVLTVFVGTGVGGGIILGSQPFEGGAGGAGEFGHLVVRQGGAVCPCGRRGCVEAYAGRRAMALAAERALASGRPTILFEVMREKGKNRPTSGVFLEAYERGDELVADLLDDAIDALGAGIASAVNLLDVDVVVLGGGLADKFGERFRMRVDAAMRPHLFLQPPRVKLVAAALGDEGGAIGAALLAG
jgi:glucokinase